MAGADLELAKQLIERALERYLGEGPEAANLLRLTREHRGFEDSLRRIAARLIAGTLDDMADAYLHGLLLDHAIEFKDLADLVRRAAGLPIPRAMEGNRGRH